jgi:hypothetical protein
MVRIPCEHVRNDFAKSSRKQTFIHMPDGLVYFFLAGGDSTLEVSGRVTHLD